MLGSPRKACLHLLRVEERVPHRGRARCEHEQGDDGADEHDGARGRDRGGASAPEQVRPPAAAREAARRRRAGGEQRLLVEVGALATPPHGQPVRPCGRDYGLIVGTEV